MYVSPLPNVIKPLQSIAILGQGSGDPLDRGNSPSFSDHFSHAAVPLPG